MDTNSSSYDSSADASLAAVVSSLKGTLCEKMGMKVLELSPHGGRIEMPIEGNQQPAGLLHGGASIALAETLVSLAAVLRAQELYGPEATAVGTSYAATHHRPGTRGYVTAVGRAQHLGTTVASYVVEIQNEDGAVLSTVLGSAHVLKPRGAQHSQN